MKTISNMNNRDKGYTLIELLAVAGLIMAISGLIGGILFSSLRGGAKSKSTNEVSQNGNQALSIITRAIAPATLVTAIDGLPITDCVTPHPSGQSISLLQADGATTTLACNSEVLTQNDGATTTKLIDDTKVKVESGTCSFTCKQQDPLAVPIVEIEFTVTQKITSPSVEDSARSNFRTSITLRNFNAF